MANDSTELSFLGERYLRKLEKVSLAWRQSKASGGPRNVALKAELHKVRSTYREKYRPLVPEGRGVSNGKSPT